MKQVVDTTDQMSHLRALVSHACAHSECEDEIKGLKFIIQMLRLDREIAAGEAAISAHDAAQCLMSKKIVKLQADYKTMLELQLAITSTDPTEAMNLVAPFNKVGQIEHITSRQTSDSQ